MSELILHHYWASPYAEKIRCILGFKGLAWKSVEISAVMPRPLLMPLTGGHRRSPVLQVGADVYCDTRRIARFLEEHAPEPSLFPAGSRGVSELLSNWAEPRTFLSTGPVRLQTAADIAHLFEGCVAAEAFVADRAPFMQPALDVFEAPVLVPAAKDQLRCFLGTLSGLLADGRSFLAGDRLSLADFSAYHTVWWLRRPPRVAAMLEEFAELEAWAERVAAVGHGSHERISAEAAYAVARDSAPRERAVADPADPAGRKVGDRVRISADDYGRDEVRGRVVELSRDTVAVLRVDAELGPVVNHFPRIGFRVLGAPSSDDR